MAGHKCGQLLRLVVGSVGLGAGEQVGGGVMLAAERLIPNLCALTKPAALLSAYPRGLPQVEAEYKVEEFDVTAIEAAEEEREAEIDEDEEAARAADWDEVGGWAVLLAGCMMGQRTEVGVHAWATCSEGGPALILLPQCHATWRLVHPNDILPALPPCCPAHPQTNALAAYQRQVERAQEAERKREEADRRWREVGELALPHCLTCRLCDHSVQVPPVVPPVLQCHQCCGAVVLWMPIAHFAMQLPGLVPSQLLGNCYGVPGICNQKTAASRCAALLS